MWKLLKRFGIWKRKKKAKARARHSHFFIMRPVVFPRYVPCKPLEEEKVYVVIRSWDIEEGKIPKRARISNVRLDRFLENFVFTEEYISPTLKRR